MGKRLAMFLLFVLIGALCPAMTFAQGRRGGIGGGAVRARSGPVQMDERTVLGLFSAILNLNDSQQQQLHTAFDAAVITAAPIATQIASN